MMLRRRGRRTKPISFSKTVFSPEQESEAILSEFVNKLHKPVSDLPKTILFYRKWYDSFTNEQQKNLIDKIANQILYAHPDMVARVFKNLRRISLDLGQKTEVLFRQKLLNL